MEISKGVANTLAFSAELLSSVPDVVWSGIVASGLTLMGVMLSNRSNTDRLILQLSHDSNQKERDRSLALKRDLYLKVAEEVAKVNTHLSKIPRLDPLTQNLEEGLSDYFATAAKIHLVSTAETAELCSELTMRYGEMFVRLLLKAEPIHSLQFDINLYTDAANKYQRDADRIISAMREMNEAGNPDPHRMEALRRSFDYSQEQASVHNNAREEAQEGIPNAHKDYAISLLGELRSVATLQMNFISSVRRELNLESSSSSSEEQLDASHQRMNLALEELVGSLEKRRGAD
ncbi:hypothetical protein [Xanthomonas euroxanthea]|uniref:hypothetical protein n=1 Tax=Xanthomonas euroxanthea TaxID=2259622 RepID=UPI0011B03C47|nr:hypothetical protein [Xanthomonas euroxanthea]